LYKLKMKVGLVFDRGRDFIILLGISVHSLLIRAVAITQLAATIAYDTSHCVEPCSTLQ